MAPLIQQGGGFVNAVAVIDLKSHIASEPSMNLGASNNLTTHFTIALRNSNPFAVTYELSHSPSVTVLSTSKSNKAFKFFPPYSHVYLDPTFPSSVTVPADSLIEISVDFSIPTQLSSELGPIFQGKILLQGNNGDKLGVPYVGTLTDNMGAWTNEPAVYGIEKGVAYEVKQNSIVNVSLLSVPQLMFANQDGASYLTFGLVEEDYTLDRFTVPLVPGTNGFINHLYGDGILYMFPMPYVGRSEDDAAIPIHMFSNGSAIASGKYRVLGAMLPASFLPGTSLDHWVTYLSEPFEYVVEQTLDTDKPDNINAIFGERSLVSAVTSTSELGSPYEPIQLMIALRYKQTIGKGTVAEIKLPQELTSLPSWYYGWDSRYSNTANITISPSNVLTITFLEDVHTNDLSGTINILCSLKNPEAYTQTGRYFFSFEVDGAHSLAFLNLKGIDQTIPTAHSNRIDFNGIRWLDVDIPSELGDWTKINFTATITAGQDDIFFSAQDPTLVESTGLDRLNNISAAIDCTSVTHTSTSFQDHVISSLTLLSTTNGTLRVSFPLSGQVEAGSEYRIAVTLRTLFTSESDDLVFNLNTILNSTPGLAGTTGVTFKIVYSDELEGAKYQDGYVNGTAARYIGERYRKINGEEYQYMNEAAYLYINQEANRYINKDYQLISEAYRLINKNPDAVDKDYQLINGAYRLIYKLINNDPVSDEDYKKISEAYQLISVDDMSGKGQDFKEAYMLISRLMDKNYKVSSEDVQVINQAYRLINVEYRVSTGVIDKDYQLINEAYKLIYKLINKEAVSDEDYKVINEAYRLISTNMNGESSQVFSEAYKLISRLVDKNYEVNENDFRVINEAYHLISVDYKAASGDSKLFSKAYQLIYKLINKESVTAEDYKAFNEAYKLINTDSQANSQGSQVFSEAYRLISKLADTNYQVSNEDYKVISEAYHLINVDYRLASPDYKLINTDYRLSSAAYKLINTDGYRKINHDAYMSLDSSQPLAEPDADFGSAAFQASEPATAGYSYSTEAMQYRRMGLNAYRYMALAGYRRADLNGFQRLAENNVLHMEANAFRYLKSSGMVSTRSRR